MKKGLVVYASIMMGVSFIILIFLLMAVSGSVVGAINPELGLSRKTAAIYLTNDSYRRCHKNLEEASEDEVTLHREIGYQAVLKDERRNSLRGLLSTIPIVGFAGFICALHWRLIKRKDN